MVAEKGVRWNVGKVFLQRRMIYQFNVRPETGYGRPPLINLQQYYVEGYLVERALRMQTSSTCAWKSTVGGVACTGRGRTQLDTPEVATVSCANTS